MEGKKILIIDDEEAIRLSMLDFFEDEGLEVLVSESAENALEILKKEKIDVAIVDIRLPGMNGARFIENAYEINQGVYFLIHTGSVQFKLTPELKKIGITEDKVLLKPIKDLNLILEKIKSFF